MFTRVWLTKRTGADDNGDSIYAVVAHYNTPAGLNGSGLAWPQVLVYNKYNKTQLTVGAGPTNITQAELDAITAGTKVETQFWWTVPENWTEPGRQSDLHDKTRDAVSKHWKTVSEELWYYGFTATYED